MCKKNAHIVRLRALTATFYLSNELHLICKQVYWIRWTHQPVAANLNSICFRSSTIGPVANATLCTKAIDSRRTKQAFELFRINGSGNGCKFLNAPSPFDAFAF